MYVDRADFRDIQQLLRENLAEGGGDVQVGLDRAHCVEPFLPADALELQHFDAVLLRGELYGAGGERHFAPLRAVWLRAAGGHVESRGDERFKRRHAELRRAHENDFHSLFSFCISASSSSVTSRSCLSMYIVPSR